MSDERPRLRALDMIPVQAHGRQQFLLRDPHRLSAREMIVPADIAFLLSQLDGSRTVREAQVAYVRRFRTLLTTDNIKELLGQLDEALFLDTERFRQHKAQAEADFRARPTRAGAHAGRSYEETAAAFVSSWEPRLSGARVPEDFSLDPQRPVLIAPHYDMNAAAQCYAAAYALLARTSRPDVVVLLGISHSSGGNFSLTRKPYETPFGALETDPRLLDQLVDGAGFDLLADEFAHRDEHSIEFQAVLLHYLYRDEDDPPRIVPILCGAYHRNDGEFLDPAQSGPANDFLDLLCRTLAGDSRAIAVIASADLSHIGARFGQPPPLTQAHLDMARRHDMAVLEMTQAGDAAGLYRTLSEEHDRYNVCGFPAIYALLRAVPIEEGRVLDYQQAAEPKTQSCVSFATVALR